MPASHNLGEYAAKMREHVHSGTDLEVDVRFVDMLSARRSRILDIGCGIGSAVNGLRARGHEAYGVDPSRDVLEVAHDLYDPAWFRLMDAADLTASRLAHIGWPQSYDAVIMAGNVPAFLPDLASVVGRITQVLRTGGLLIIGTTAGAKGGPAEQDHACAAAGLELTHRYSDWHLGEFRADSPWSVSVFAKDSSQREFGSPDGMFILPSPTAT